MPHVEKHEFGSEGWFAHAEQVLKDLVEEASAELDGVRFSACEVFTDPPEHLRQGGQPKIYWYFEIADGQAVMLREERAVADHRVSVDYQKVLPHVRIRHEPPTEDSRPSRLPPALRRLLLELHNRIADATA